LQLIKTKLKTQSSKLKTTTQTLKLTFGHPEDEVRRIPCQASEGFFADAQNDDKKSQNSKLKTQNYNSKLKTFYCVILRAEPEGSHAKKVRDSSLTLRMTMKNSKLKTFYCVILRAEPEGSHANSFFVILNEVNDPMPSK